MSFVCLGVGYVQFVCLMQACILWWHSGGLGVGVVGIVAWLVEGVCVGISAVWGDAGVIGV